MWKTQISNMLPIGNKGFSYTISVPVKSNKWKVINVLSVALVSIETDVFIVCMWLLQFVYSISLSRKFPIMIFFPHCFWRSWSVCHDLSIVFRTFEGKRVVLITCRVLMLPASLYQWGCPGTAALLLEGTVKQYLTCVLLPTTLFVPHLVKQQRCIICAR